MGFAQYILAIIGRDQCDWL